MQAGASGQGPFRGNPNVETRDHIQGKVVDQRPAYFKGHSRSLAIETGLKSTYTQNLEKAAQLRNISNANFTQTE